MRFLRYAGFRIALPAVAMLVAGAALAQSPMTDRERKLYPCFWHPEELIGLDYVAMSRKCGPPSKVNSDIYGSTKVEQIIYSLNWDGSPPAMYVYLRNGVVTSVQKR